MVEDKFRVARPLRYQLLIGFAVVLSLTALTTVALTYNSLKKSSEKNIRNRAKNITESIEFAAEGLIETGDVYRLNRLVQNFASWPKVQKICIIDAQGIILAHGDGMEKVRGKKYSEVNPSLYPLFQQVSVSGIPQYKNTNIKGGQVVVYALPFNTYSFPKFGSRNFQNPRAVTIAILDRDELAQEAYQLTLLIVVSSVISGSVILFLVSLLIQHFVLTPLGKLHRALMEYEQLNKFILPSLPQNEINFLGQTLAQTFAQLEIYQREALEISEQKYVEIAQRYDLASQATRVWIWEWQIKTNHLEVDSNLFYWLGFDNVSLEKTPDFFIYPGDRDLFWQTIQQNLVSNTPKLSGEYRLQARDGKLYHCLFRGQIYQDKDGKQQRIIGTIADITERKKAEEKLKLSNQILAKATQLKDEFLANMSHELRTPLNAILGMTEGLQQKVYGTLNDKQIHALAMVETSGKHLLSLINDILDLSKIEAGRMELDLNPTNVNSLCAHSLTFVRQFALQKQISLLSEIPANLPEIRVDKRRLCQVLINLLNNAIKFTPEGGNVTLSVSKVAVDVQENDNPEFNYLRFAVKDTGIGITSENLTTLFKPFVQIDSALNRRYEGTGLGLALVKNIVELHGGSVGATSEIHQGSEFFITVPYTCQSGSKDLNGETPETLGGETNSRALLIPRINLFTDNAAYANTVSSYLRAKGYSLQWLNHTPQAIAQLQEDIPDLVIVDFPNPGGEAVMILDKIRQALGAAPLF